MQSENGLFHGGDSPVVYGSIEGQHYSVPISTIEEEYDFFSMSKSGAGSTVASNESPEEQLLERYDIYSTVSDDSDDDDSNASVGPSCSDAFFEFLGFESNPMVPTSITDVRNSAAADMRLSMLTNFSTAYNVISISLPLEILATLYGTSAAEKSLCSSALIAGMIVGQLVGGALGDLLGRHRAMTVVMFLQVFAALAAACSSDVSFLGIHWSVYQVLAAFRFIGGLGCGGSYPLAATLTAESSRPGNDRAKSVALTFSFQGIGYFSVNLFSWLVVVLLKDNFTIAWRFIMGTGAVPGLVLTILRMRSAQEFRHRRVTKADLEPAVLAPHPEEPLKVRAVPASLWDAIRLQENLVLKLLGTGGCWLLFDVLFYGNTLFQPVVLAAAFGNNETIAKTARDSVIISTMALPGYFMSVFAIGRQSPRFIQKQGFFVMGMLYLVIGILFDTLAQNRVALLIVYGATFFFSNYGPNTTTFLLPSMTFSRSCRSTLNGICAACGKTGALLGSIIFVTFAQSFGHCATFCACALLAFIGCLLTLVGVSPRVGMEEEREGEGVMTYKEAEALLQAGLGGRPFRVPMKIVFSEPSLIDHVALI